MEYNEQQSSQPDMALFEAWSVEACNIAEQLKQGDTTPLPDGLLTLLEKHANVSNSPMFELIREEAAKSVTEQTPTANQAQWFGEWLLRFMRVNRTYIASMHTFEMKLQAEFLEQADAFKGMRRPNNDALN